MSARATSAAGARFSARVDLDRDQSYFLFATTQQQLDFLRFPLGDLTKDETRAIARELGLAVADKHDSQDICFVPQGRYSDIVEKLKPSAVRPGEIVHVDGRVLGRHDGVIRYTVGQRRGLGIAAGEPLFVVRLDAENARVVVGPREALATRRDRAARLELARRTGRSTTADEGLPVFARVRSTRPPAAARSVRRGRRARSSISPARRGRRARARPASSTTATVPSAASWAAARSPRAVAREAGRRSLASARRATSLTLTAEELSQAQPFLAGTSLGCERSPANQRKFWEHGTWRTRRQAGRGVRAAGEPAARQSAQSPTIRRP